MSAVQPSGTTVAPDGALKVPPHSVEAEQSVLGGLMLVAEAWDQIADRIVESDFYRPEHRVIFRAIRELATVDMPRDAVTLGEWFERNGDCATIGGVAYLAELANDTPSAANIQAYADIVRDKAQLRGLIDAGTRIASDAFQPGRRATQEIIEAAEQRILEIGDAGARRGREPVGPRRGLADWSAALKARVEAGGQLTGLTTGFADIDNLTSGLQKQDLVIVAGRPSMGKTAFALNIAEFAALRTKQPVLVFSMEMSMNQCWSRLVASLARADLAGILSGQLSAAEGVRVAQSADLLAASSIYIDDTAALSPGELRARARRMMREHGLGLVVIDYLQLMQVPGSKENRASEISEISRNLKAMAKELNVPVIALSQLNRALEQRNDKRPLMSDLRESGAIEQDADLILFIYRDEVYNKQSNAKGIAEVIIGKQRNGPIGTVKLKFLGQYTRFENHRSET